MESPELDSRRQRAAANESLFREVNERIEDIAERFRLNEEIIDFLCECARTDCAQRVQMRRSDYEALRRVATHFAVARGHEESDVETVIDSKESYVIVAKRGSAAAVARELDPREPSRA